MMFLLAGFAERVRELLRGRRVRSSVELSPFQRLRLLSSGEVRIYGIEEVDRNQSGLEKVRNIVERLL